MLRHAHGVVIGVVAGDIGILLVIAMSTGQRKRTDKEASTLRPGRIDVEQHAELRFLQRVDPTAQNPAERLRQMFRAGYPDPSADINGGRCRRAGEHLIVYRGSEDRPQVITVLIAGDRK